MWELIMRKVQRVIFLGGWAIGKAVGLLLADVEVEAVGRHVLIGTLDEGEIGHFGLCSVHNGDFEARPYGGISVDFQSRKSQSQGNIFSVQGLVVIIAVLERSWLA
jgi:hypothetical protein